MKRASEARGGASGLPVGSPSHSPTRVRTRICASYGEVSRETGINYVFAPENQAVIGGYEGFGFFILVPQGCVFANTAEGVQRVVEEFALPEVGWS